MSFIIRVCMFLCFSKNINSTKKEYLINLRYFQSIIRFNQKIHEIHYISKIDPKNKSEYF